MADTSATAGLDFRHSANVLSPEEGVAFNNPRDLQVAAEAATNLKNYADPAYQAQQKRTFTDSLSDAFKNEATAGVLRAIEAPVTPPDPAFTPEKFSARLKDAAASGLEAPYFNKLADVSSEVEFDRALANAKAQQDREKALNGDNMRGIAAHILAGVFDPVTLAAAIGTGSALSTGAKLARIKMLSAPREAISGLAAVGAKDQFSYGEVHASEYIAAGALGFGAGYMFGPAANNARLAGTSVTDAIGEDGVKMIAIGKKLEGLLDDQIRTLEPRQPKIVKKVEPVEPTVVPKEPVEPVAPVDPTAPVEPVQDPAISNLLPGHSVPEPPNNIIKQFEEELIYKPKPKPIEVEAKQLNTEASDAVVAQIKSAAGEGSPISQIADDTNAFIKKFTAKADNDVARPIENAGASLSEKLALAEDAAKYKAPHVHPVHPAATHGRSFTNLPAHIERDILSLAGKSVERLRAMGYDVRAFLDSQSPKRVLIHGDRDVNYRGLMISGKAEDKVSKMVGVNARLSPKLLARIMEHEEIHALRKEGAFTPEEWNTLVEASKQLKPEGSQLSIFDDAHTGPGSGSYQSYTKAGMTGQKLKGLGEEEAVARMIGNEAIIGLEGSPAAAIVAKIKSAGYAAEVRAKAGIDSPIRFDAGAPATPPPGAVNAAGVPLRNTKQPIEEEFLNAVGLSNLTDAEVAKTFRAWGLAPRLDGAGWLGSSVNHMTRILGDLLANDTVGKIGHAINGQAVELFKSRLHAINMHKYTQAASEGMTEYAAARGQRVTVLNQADINREFQREVGMNVRGLTPAGQISPGVEKASQAFRDVMEEMAKYAKNPLKDQGGVGRSLPGAENLEPNANYFTRRFHLGNLNGFIEKHGFENVKNTVKKAMSDSQPTLTDPELDMIATGYLTRVHTNANGVEEDLGMVLASGKRDYLHGELRKMGIGEDEAKNLVAKLIPEHGGGDVTPRLKHKTLLNENAEHTFTNADGTTSTLKFHEMLDHDADRILSAYSQRMSGRVALGQIQYKNPSTGELLINGINSDAEFETLLKHMQDAGLKNTGKAGYSPETLKDEVQHLRWVYDRLLSRPLDNQNGNFVAALRLARSAQYFKLINVGFQQISEAGTVVSNMGLRAALQQMPALGGILATMKGGLLSTKAAKKMFREIQAIGVGVDGAHGMSSSYGIEAARVGEASATGMSPGFARASDAISSLNKAVSTLSRMPAITDAQQVGAAAAFAQKLYNIGTKAKIGKADMNRFAQLGLSEDMATRIIAQLRTPGIIEKSTPFLGERIGLLNFHKWTDREASAALQNAMFRASRKAIQSNDIGMMNQFMSGPVAQTMLQFKSFSINGWANHSLYAVHHADMQGAIGLSVSAGLAATLYSLQMYAQAQGRSDRDKFLQEKLSPGATAAGAWQRIGASSITTMLYDSTIPNFTNTKPIFTSGSTGSKSILSAPLLGTFDGLAVGVNGAIAQASGGRPMAQTEVNSFASAIPFARWAAFAPILNGLTAGLPKKAPRAEDLLKATQ